MITPSECSVGNSFAQMMERCERKIDDLLDQLFTFTETVQIDLQSFAECVVGQSAGKRNEIPLLVQKLEEKYSKAWVIRKDSTTEEWCFSDPKAQTTAKMKFHKAGTTIG